MFSEGWKEVPREVEGISGKKVGGIWKVEVRKLERRSEH